MTRRSDGVLIVGAGPTGLTLANALAAYGVDFTIVDSKPGPTSDSKGLAINVASQYAFQLLGVDELLSPAGALVGRLAIWWQGARLSAIDFRHLSFPIRQFITQPQALTERKLVAALARRGHAVAWNSTVREVTQQADGVQVRICSAGGEHARRFDFAVGCDGKASLIRPAMGAALSGHDYPMHFVLGDFKLDWEGPADTVSYHVYAQDFFILVPLGAGHWRVVVKYDGAIPATALNEQAITSIVTRYLGRNIFIERASWISRAPFYYRLSDRLRTERLFLAGDAAHLFSPIGGTGMNTGIQDALNLGWKLAWYIRGLGGEALLDSYQSERLQAIASAAMASDRSTRLISRSETDPSLIEPLLPRMRNRRHARVQLPLLHSGLMLSYSADVLHGGSCADGAGRLCHWAGALWERLCQARARPAPHLALLVLAWPASDAAWPLLPVLRELAHAANATLVIMLAPACHTSSSSDLAPLITLATDAVPGFDLEPGVLAWIRPDAIIGHLGTLDRIDDFKYHMACH